MFALLFYFFRFQCAHELSRQHKANDNLENDACDKVDLTPQQAKMMNMVATLIDMGRRACKCSTP